MNRFHLLKHIVAILLLVFVLETSIVAGRLSYGECTGNRLDNALTTSAGRCVALGGTCCDIGGYMINDPRTMKTTDQCLTCYNPSVKVKCTGKLIRVRPAVWGVDANSWITAAKCISLNGQCCDNGRTRFCPKSSPKELFCNDCYAGINTSAGCSGRLLASSYFTPSVCIKFGGRCCDGNFRGNRTGSAFAPTRIFNSAVGKECNMCYNGRPNVIN